jgi:hypothetical protein
VPASAGIRPGLALPQQAERQSNLTRLPRVSRSRQNHPIVEEKRIMTLDIRGSLKNTKLSHNPYVVLEEMVSNAIDSFLIRKASDSSVEDMRIAVEVRFSARDLVGDSEVMALSCRDNGCGLGDDQLAAFLTKDTSYKDDLAIAGIGQCKGAGRIQYFHHFAGVALDSTFLTKEGARRRVMNFREPKKQLDFSDFMTSDGVVSDVGTLVALDELKDSVHRKVFQEERLSEVFSATRLRQRTLVAFLQRLVGLAGQLGDFEISFRTEHWKEGADTEYLRASDLPEMTASVEVNVAECDPQSGKPLGRHQPFRVVHYQLDPAHYDLPRNAIALCAKASPVRDLTGYYLKTRAEQNNPINGNYHIVLVEAAYLDEHVNEQRDDFDDLPEDIPDTIFNEGTISHAAIHEAIDPVIGKMVVPASWRREDVLVDIETKFGVSAAMLEDTDTRVRHGDNAKTVVERVLKKYQERVIGATSQIFDLKEEIARTEPDSEDFRKKINELSWTYTSSLKDFDMANLSQLVVRRAAIVEVLDLACGKQLAMQVNTGGAKRKDERIIHSIFFPMRKDSEEVDDHDIWLLSEEYHYYDYIASDKPLAEIEWQGLGKLFEPDIDAGFEALLQKRAETNRAKRPDIALFSDEGSAIIVEFKAPGVSMDDHVGDLSEYAHLLAAKSRGKLRKFYCYLIGDTLNPLRLSGWTRFAEGKGYFQSTKLPDPETGLGLGEMYSEILHYDDLVTRARKRIGVYRDKLGIEI